MVSKDTILFAARDLKIHLSNLMQKYFELSITEKGELFFMLSIFNVSGNANEK